MLLYSRNINYNFANKFKCLLNSENPKVFPHLKMLLRYPPWDSTNLIEDFLAMQEKTGFPIGILDLTV